MQVQMSDTKLPPLFYVISAAAIVGAGIYGWTIFAPQIPEPEPEVIETSQIQAPYTPSALNFTPVYEPCAHCHLVGEEARNSTGPVLNGIFDRPAGTTEYPYSTGMKSSGIVWDEDTLRTFIANPGDVITDTRMIFGGLPEDEVDGVIEFLKSVQNYPFPAPQN